MPRNFVGADFRLANGYTREAMPRGIPTDSATENKPPLRGFQISNLKFEIPGGVRVKRWSKSPPLQAQARRHGKPHRVQGQIGDHGAARSTCRESGIGPGYWLLRQMVLSARKSEDKIRLTALPKSPSTAVSFQHRKRTGVPIPIDRGQRNHVWFCRPPGSGGNSSRQDLCFPFAATAGLQKPSPHCGVPFPRCAYP